MYALAIPKSYQFHRNSFAYMRRARKLGLRRCAARTWFKVKSLRYDKKLRRYVLFSLSANVVGYTAVYLLVSQGVMGTWWANTTVSKGMAPVGLALNTLALTDKLLPSRGQAAKWLMYWLPSAFVGAVFLAIVVANSGLGGIQARAAVGLMIFPFDYLVKRFVVFAKQARLGAYLFKYWFPLVFAGFLAWKRLVSLSGVYPVAQKTEMA